MTDLAIPKSHRPQTLPRVPDTGLTVIEIAEHLARSGFFSDTREVSQAVAKILAGIELGIGPIAAMSGLHVIKGKVAIGANVLASLVKASGKYDYRIHNFSEASCTVEIFERGESLGESTYTIKEAERAGLTAPSRSGEPSNWLRYPRNMLFARALSNAVRWYCPDVTSGPVYAPEELGAVIDGETGEVISLPASAQAPSPAPTADTDSAPRPGEPGYQKLQARVTEARPSTRREQWEAGYATLLQEATFIEVPLEPLEKFFALQARLAEITDPELHMAIKELKSLVNLRRLELQDAPAEEEAEERHQTLDGKMDRANADEDPR